MAKEVIEKFRMQIPAGQATPGPPVGVAMGPRSLNPGLFCKDFNERTRDLQGTTVTVELTVYKDKTFTFVVLKPPASVLLKKAAGIVLGSGVPNKEKVGKVTRAQVEAIAKEKMVDLNTKDLAKAVKQIEGSARSMGIDIVD
jgi:large subunit ribosomal protein L11